MVTDWLCANDHLDSPPQRWCCRHRKVISPVSDTRFINSLIFHIISSNVSRTFIFIFLYSLLENTEQSEKAAKNMVEQKKASFWRYMFMRLGWRPIPNHQRVPRSCTIPPSWIGGFLFAKCVRSQNHPLVIVKCRLQGTRKVVKSEFEPTFYLNSLQVKNG